MVATARRLPRMTPRVALLATAAVVVGIVLYAGREALGPFIVGLLIVYLLAPPIEWLGPPPISGAQPDPAAPARALGVRRDGPPPVRAFHSCLPPEWCPCIGRGVSIVARGVSPWVRGQV